MILYATMQTSLARGLSIVGPGANLSILTTNLAFSVYAYIFLIPLLLFGIKVDERSVLLSWMIVWIMGLALSALPGQVFQDIGYRWVLLLSLPLLLLAYESYSKLRVSRALVGRNWGGLLRVVVIISLSSSAILYAILPAQSALTLYTVFPQYVPTSMVQSSLPSSDYPNVVNAMLWVDSHLDPNSVLITQQAFYGWAPSYLSSDKQRLNSFLSSPTSAIHPTASYTHALTA